MDPPYVSTGNVADFIKYNEVLFAWNDQERLLQSLVAAKERESKIVATNADFGEIRKFILRRNLR